jgi:peptide/nickel transport system permease protein
MSWWMWIIAALVVIAVVAYAVRWAGQKATGNTPFFRDMPFGVAYGYVAGVLLLYWIVTTYIGAKL